MTEKKKKKKKVTEKTKQVTEKKKKLTEKKKTKKKKTATVVQPEGSDEQLVGPGIDCNGQSTEIPAARGDTHCSCAIPGRGQGVRNDRGTNATDILWFSSDMATLLLFAAVQLFQNLGSLWSTRLVCICWSFFAGPKGSHASSEQVLLSRPYLCWETNAFMALP